MRPTTASTHLQPTQAAAWKRLASALAAASVVLLGACGGGGFGTDDTAGVGTGGTGSFAVGTVTGLGSVFVGGVRYGIDGARLIDDDGNVTVLGDDAGPLQVGMVVEVSGEVDDSGSVRTAKQIAYGAELKGPVTAVDAAAGSFEVFGVTVRTGATTVYGNFGGVAALAVGNVVEVSGQPDTNGSIVATFVEREAASIAAFVAGGGTYRLRGAVAGFGGSFPSPTFSVRGVAIATNAGTDIDGTLANGASVSVRLNPTALGNGRYLAERVKVRSAGFDVPSAAEGEVEGYVSGFTGTGSDFRVAGYPVRLAAGVVYEDGMAADLQDGIRVEAKGSVEGDVLVVTKLEFKSRDDNDDGNDEDIAGAEQEFEFKGTAACGSCGAIRGTFTVKGVSVSYDAGTELDDGLTGATLDGRAIEVKGVAEVTSSGTVYRATRIRLDD